ncbi:MAG: ABC transporter permease [Rhodothermales bacterium]
MPSRFERFMAVRYFRSARGREEGRRFIRFITYVAVGGVAIGVAALLLALSIVRGFSEEIEAKIVGFGAHVQVESYQDAPLGDSERLQSAVATFDGVRGVTPVVQEFALLRRSSQDIDGVAIWGSPAPPPYLREHLVSGEFDVAPDRAGRPGVVIGARLAGTLGLAVGDKVTSFSMRKGDNGPRPSVGSVSAPRVKQFHVAGIYETSLANFDELYAFTSIDAARDLLGYAPDEVTRLDVTLSDVSVARETAVAIEDSLGFPVMARSIYEVYSGLFAWVNLQEGIIPIVISVIVIVAAFNIIGTLLMMILEKTREIGILESMGASRRSLRRLFLWMGVLIGGVGTVIGEALALALALIQQRYELIPLPEEAYYMKTAPIDLNGLDFVVVAVIALLLCTLAAYLPARVAARVEPIRAIHFR